MKLGKVEFCHFLQIIALFLCLSGMNQTELSRSKSKPYFQPGRSRTKRSWVWNQFFVLEEYMGPDPLYVGKVGNLIKPFQGTDICLLLHGVTMHFICTAAEWYKRLSTVQKFVILKHIYMEANPIDFNRLRLSVINIPSGMVATATVMLMQVMYV